MTLTTTEPHPTGRPLSITPTKAARYLSALAGGNYKGTAAAYAGIPKRTLRDWELQAERELARVTAEGHDTEILLADWLTEHPATGYRPDSAALNHPGPPEFDPKYWPVVALLALAEKATADAEVSAVANVIAAGQTSWQASMTYLERKYPERWGRRDRVAVEGSQGGPVQVEHTVNVDELVSKIASLRASAEQGDVVDAEIVE